MASAAAVAADAARSPLGRDVDETNGITSAITANDDDHTGLTDDDEDEDVVPNKSRRTQRPAVSGQDDEEEDGLPDDENDLFGDEDDPAPEKV